MMTGEPYEFPWGGFLIILSWLVGFPFVSAVITGGVAGWLLKGMGLWPGLWAGCGMGVLNPFPPRITTTQPRPTTTAASPRIRGRDDGPTRTGAAPDKRKVLKVLSNPVALRYSLSDFRWPMSVWFGLYR